MAIICVTDDPYMRDFYHWILQGHWEGGFNPVDEGFEWNVAGGEINNISIGYPKQTFWYELGNNPDYLSSRKIYWYRAWHTYYDGEELIKIYGEMKQFTAINPNCTGFTNFEAKNFINKYYSYHGELMACKIKPQPGTFECVPTNPLGAMTVVREFCFINVKQECYNQDDNEVFSGPCVLMTLFDEFWVQAQSGFWQPEGETAKWISQYTHALDGIVITEVVSLKVYCDVNVFGLNGIDEGYLELWFRFESGGATKSVYIGKITSGSIEKKYSCDPFTGLKWTKEQAAGCFTYHEMHAENIGGLYPEDKQGKSKTSCNYAYIEVEYIGEV